MHTAERELPYVDEDGYVVMTDEHRMMYRNYRGNMQEGVNHYCVDAVLMLEDLDPRICFIALPATDNVTAFSAGVNAYHRRFGNRVQFVEYKHAINERGDVTYTAFFTLDPDED